VVKEDLKTKSSVLKPKSLYMIRVNDGRKTFWDLFIILIAIWNCVCIPL
jgi:hypothetical protein